MRFLFIGCVESSYRLLSRLLERKKNVVGVVTKKESDFNADYVDLAPLCNKYHVPYHYVKNVNDEDCIEFIRLCFPDICYCFGWSQLLKKELIDLFPRGVVGFHPAALPNNRGRHPFIWALALGLEETASTFFMITTGTDEGDILSQRHVKIDYQDNAKTLYDKVLDVAVEQEMEFTELLEKGTATLIPQNVETGNFWRKRGKEDGRIDWRMPSRGIYNLVRSLSKPYIGAHFVYNGADYKVWKALEIETIGLENIEPGKVLAVSVDGTMDVKAGIGGIRLIDFDNPGMSVGDYL